MSKKIINTIWIATFILVFTFSIIQANREKINNGLDDKGELKQVSSNTSLSNTKIGWGIKRAKNHEQPELGSQNLKLMEKYNGIAMGNKDEKYVYLTFDEGYEAGYTDKILSVLKANEVEATFFITAHYLNTQPDLVKRMIDDGHIVGNHIPLTLMALF